MSPTSVDDEIKMLKLFSYVNVLLAKPHHSNNVNMLFLNWIFIF